MEKEVKISKEELLKKLIEEELFERWRRDPMAWLEERLGEPRRHFMWSEHEGYENHKWDGNKDPIGEAWMTFGRAYEAVQRGEDPEYRNVALESATGTGKTYTLARIVFWFLDCFPNSLVVTTAPSDSQIKSGLWAEISTIFPKIIALRPNAKKWQGKLVMQAPRNFAKMDATEREKSLGDSWMAKTHITGTSANKESEDKFRGFHRKSMLILLEECTGIPHQILTAAQNTSTGMTNYILAVGNPSDQTDTLHTFAELPSVKNFRVSAYDHPNIVLQEELYHGAITQVSINERLSTYGAEHGLFKAMVRGISPPQSKDSLIRREWIDKCVNNPNKDKLYGHDALGVDVANSELGDKAAVVYGKGCTVYRMDEFQCPNATHLGYNLVYEDEVLAEKGYDDYNIPTMFEYGIQPYNIGIDGVGVGTATVNAFIDMGLPNVESLMGGQWNEAIPTIEDGPDAGKPKFRFGSLRSQMWWQLREDFRMGKINLALTDADQLEALKRELTVPKVTMRENAIAVEAKEQIKKRLGHSPNLGDALAYWNWMRNGYRVDAGFVAARS